MSGDLCGPCEKKRKKSILVIDDDDRYRFALKRKLSLYGFDELLLASTAAEACRVIEKESTDVILMDIHFEETDGIFAGMECLKSFRSAGVESLIVMVSGDERPNTFLEALRLGADDYWIKGAYLDIAVELEILFSRAKKNRKQAWTPLDIISLGYPRTMNLSDADIAALRVCAKKCMQHADGQDISGRFQNRKQVWGMFLYIFGKLCENQSISR